MKAILYTLIRGFKFELAVSADDIERTRKFELVERPCLKSDPKSNVQLPLFITPVRLTAVSIYLAGFLHRN